MLILLVLMLALGSGSASSADDPCAALYHRADSLRRHVDDGARLDRLQALARRVRTCYRTRAPDAASSLARRVATYAWLVAALEQADRFDAAQAEYAAFFQRLRGVADSATVATMYNERGLFHYRRGTLSASIDDFASSVDWTPARQPARRTERTTSLGILLQRARDFESARRYFQQAEQMARRLPPSPTQRRVLARALFNQGDLLLEDAPGTDSVRVAAQRRQAIARIEAALALFPDDALERRARAEIILGEAYSFVDDRAAAYRHLRAGLRLAEQTGDPDVLTLGWFKLGKTQLFGGDVQAAAASLQQAAAYARQADDFEDLRRALLDLGRLYEIQEDWAQAAAYYEQAIVVTKRLRASLRATDWAAAAFNEWSESYRGRIRALAAQGRHREAFLALEEARARNLQDLRLQAQFARDLPPAVRASFDSLSTRLSAVRTELARYERLDDAPDTLLSREIRLVTQRRALLNLDAPAAPSRADIQRELAAHDRTLVSYYLDAPDWYYGRPPRSFAFVVTADTLQLVPLDIDQGALQERLRAVSPVLTGAASPTLSTTRFDLEALHHLYDRLVAPLRAALPPEGPLVVVPDGPLFQLPFSMLVTAPPDGRHAYPTARYLVHERPISQELSASLLARPDRAAAGRPRPMDVIALGRSRFEASPADSAQSLRARSATLPDSTGALAPLPGVRRELAAIGDLFAQPRSLLDEEATEAAFYRLQQEATVLHLASHAFVKPDAPLNNVFVLSPSRGDGPAHDGLLYLHELDRYQNAIPLVVLSGCGTARGLLRTGEGPQGLQYAFRAMGAESTLSMLWEIDDEVAVALTTAFYRELLQGAPKDVALQRAQRRYLATHDQRLSPFYWASAVLYGAPEPLALREASALPVPPLAAGGAALLALALAGFLWHRGRLPG